MPQFEFILHCIANFLWGIKIEIINNNSTKESSSISFQYLYRALFIRKILFSARFGLEIGGIIVDEECRPRTKNIKLKLLVFCRIFAARLFTPHNNGQPVEWALNDTQKGRTRRWSFTSILCWVHVTNRHNLPRKVHVETALKTSRQCGKMLMNINFPNGH